MRLRYIAIIYTVMVAFFFGCLFHSLNKSRAAAVDMVALNSVCREVEKSLDEGIPAEALEKKYSCSIFLRTDEDYGINTNNAIADGKTIVDYEKNGQIIARIAFDNDRAVIDEQISLQNRHMTVASAALLLCGYVLLLLIYVYYVRPFKTLKLFSSNIAKGNLDFPLPMRKNNYFGAFTESFDIMREELIKARENEQRANQSKKELVAELSHDMKTPVSTIMANCEVARAKLGRHLKEEKALQKNMREAAEEIEVKLGIIEQKADMLDKLISNMLHASLEELSSLQVEPQEELSTAITEEFHELNYYNKIHFVNNVPECLVYMDKLRFNQVIDNIINNSYKYADTDIDISFFQEEKGLVIQIRDYGPGVPEDEISLVTEKYYRGSNKTGQSGSGLGLYLAAYFMNHMNGGMECYNDKGFVVKLYLAKI